MNTNEEIQKLRSLVKKQNAVIADFLPNIRNCVLQNYGLLNEALCEYTEYENSMQNSEKQTELGV